jgi:predicted TPR repeat methyltransferase/Tfp pilus assembly protein PilF
MTSRNDPCPCGSGIKYKRCCLAKRDIPAAAPRPASPAATVPEAIEWARRGAAFLDAGDNGQALECFRRSRSADPGLAFACNGEGLALQRLGDRVSAEQAFRAAIGADPTFAAAQHNLGELLRLMGRDADAIAAFTRALSVDPALGPTHLNLANLLTDLGEFDRAFGHYEAALPLGGNRAGIHASFGLALSLAGRPEDALAHYREAVALAPDLPIARLNLARCLLSLGRTAEAAGEAARLVRDRLHGEAARMLLGAARCVDGEFDAALDAVSAAAVPDGEAARRYAALAEILRQLGQRPAAIACLERAVLRDPGLASARHFLATLTDGNPEHPDDAYVAETFDACAGTFDEQLVTRLRYDAPRRLADLIARHASRAEPWDVLDLGCGTGLVGAQLAPRSRCLVGADLSANMLERCRGLGIYQRLEHASIASVLAAEPAESMDVVAAADVFIYVGRLEETFVAVHRVLRPHGLFAFSIECAARIAAGTDPQVAGYRLTPSGRYAHHGDYVQALADRSGFKVRDWIDTPLRMEFGRWIPGWLAILEA